MIKVVNRDGSWAGWITPGGGMEPGETEHHTLARELSEELSLSSFNLGPVLWLRSHKFTWAEQIYDQDEKYYLIRINKFEPKPLVEPTGFEVDAFQGFKWWPLAELLTSNEMFAPRKLASLLQSLISEGLPKVPLTIDI